MDVGVPTEDLNRIADIGALEDVDHSPQVLEVERALRATGHRALRELRVVQQGAILVLHGQVPTYHMKQLAQATAITIPGIEQVQNEVHVIAKRSPEDNSERKQRGDRRKRPRR
jgi:osmotically-inducible protein OsmY